MNQIPGPPPPSSGVRDYLPHREQAPLLVAALGVLLLTTAEVQPLIPSEYFSASIRGVPAMSRGWQTFIVALLLVVTVGAVLRGWRRIPAATAGGMLALCVAGLFINVFIIYREVSLVGLMTERAAWYPFGSMFVLPFLACVATVLLAVAPDKGFASGILLVTGAAGYFFFLQDLVAYLATFSPHPAPGRAVFIGMLGSAVTLVAGLAARGDNAVPQQKTGRTVLRQCPGHLGRGGTGGRPARWRAHQVRDDALPVRRCAVRRRSHPQGHRSGRGGRASRGGALPGRGHGYGDPALFHGTAPAGHP